MQNPFSIKRFPTIFDIVAMVIIFFLVQIILGLSLQLLGFQAPATSAIDTVDIEQYIAEQVALAKYTAIIYPIAMILAIGALWAYARYRGGKRVITIRHSKSGFNPNIILMGTFWLLSSQIILEPIATLLPHSEGSGLGRGFLACLTAIISAPILEELLCRGLIFETIHKRWGTIASIAISSLFFGIIHSDIATSFVAIIAGVIFGILYVRTSSLYTTIIIHAINNAIALALIGFGVGDLSFHDILGDGALYWSIYSIAIAIFVGCGIEAYFKVFKTKKPMANEG